MLLLEDWRSEALLRGDYGLDETWRPRLGRTSEALGVTLIDPSDALRERLNEGVHAYGDLLTLAGHDAVAEVLAKVLASVADELSAAPESDVGGHFRIASHVER